MGPGTQKKKKTEGAVPDWMADAIPVVEDQSDDWMADAIPVNDDAPLEENLDRSLRVPSLLRAEVGALNKPEDRLAAIRKTYPDAQPYGEDNFIYTSPETGNTGLYNPEGLDWGDWMSLLPEAGEMVGAGVGAAGGAVGGGFVGSAVPVLGTGAGAVTGGIAGAGAGGATGKDLTERGLNWLFGNEDTRTTGEYARDKATDFALSAAGEGIGRGVVHGGKAIANAARSRFVGGVDDVAQAASRFRDFDAAGLEPTVGMVTQTKKALDREAALAANPTSRVGRTYGAVDDALDARYNQLVTDVAGPLGVTTREGAGESLQRAARAAEDQMRANYGELYDKTTDLVGAVRSPGTNVQDLLVKFNAEKKLYGQSAKLNKGPTIDRAIKQAKALAEDAKKGISFDDLKETRTAIDKIAFDKTGDPFEKRLFGQIRDAVTKDMEEAAGSAGTDATQTWKSAEGAYKDFRSPTGSRSAIKPLAKEADPIKVYGEVTKRIKEGNAHGLARVRRELENAGGKPEWRQTVGTMLDNMGRKIDGDGVEVFNPRKYVSDFANMPDEVKDVMFKGTDLEGYRLDLEQLSRLAANRAGLNGKKSTSNLGNALIDTALSTGGAVAGAATDVAGGGFMGAIAGAVARPVKKAVADAYMDRLLTNKEFVRWLVKVPQAQIQKDGLRSHIIGLRQIQRTVPAQTAAAIDRYLRDAGYDEENSTQR
ncbi:hypothetical protein QM996_02595 [Sinorhizobium chiapasense]